MHTRLPLPDTRPAAILSEYLDEDQLAAELGVCVRTLARWRRLREAPTPTRLGRRLLTSRADIKVWLASRRREVA